VVGEDRTLTYGELNELSDRVAGALQARGCGRGDRVGLLMPKSALAVASMLGAVKAGCAYVPMDPDATRVRTAEILRQCEPRVVLMGDCPHSLLSELDLRRVLRGASIGWLGEAPAPERADFDQGDVDAAPLPSDAHATQRDVACILFTSGKGDLPRGVSLTRGSLQGLAEWGVRHFDLGPSDRLSGHASLTFNLSTFDLYVALAAGAELHQVPTHTVRTPDETAAFIEDRELTMWLSVPSQLSGVARFDALAGKELPSLRHVAWCGDVLPTNSLLYWKRLLPGVTFTNLYGHTETTVVSSHYTVPESFDDPTADIPIGAGRPGSELLVLDSELREVPEGKVGEIYVGGRGVSPGYWHDPDRTQAAFVHRRSAANGEGRLFRTGDWGTRSEDGTVSFLGHTDSHIESSGRRIAAGEVERALLQLQEVTACAVVPLTFDDLARNGIGCAYVPANGRPLRTSRVQQALAERLPPQMIPKRWMLVDELPVDTRGKVDRARTRSLMGCSQAPRISGFNSPRPRSIVD